MDWSSKRMRWQPQAKPSSSEQPRSSTERPRAEIFYLDRLISGRLNPAGFGNVQQFVPDGQHSGFPPVLPSLATLPPLICTDSASSFFDEADNVSQREPASLHGAALAQSVPPHEHRSPYSPRDDPQLQGDVFTSPPSSQEVPRSSQCSAPKHPRPVVKTVAIAGGGNVPRSERLTRNLEDRRQRAMNAWRGSVASRDSASAPDKESGGGLSE